MSQRLNKLQSNDLKNPTPLSKLSRGLLVLLFCLPGPVYSARVDIREEIPLDSEIEVQYSSWKNFKNSVQQSETLVRFNGESQIITGILALVAGLAGEAQTKRPLEKGVYSLFQSIGIASIGFGAYDLYVGSEEKKFYHLLDLSSSLNDAEKDQILRTYRRIDRVYQKRERQVKMVTFGLVALSQFYNASRVENESVKNSLGFIGAINLIAAISFSF